MSIATVALTPFPDVMSSLPRLLLHGATTATDGLPREYEVLPRVAAVVTNCAPKEVATGMAELLRPFASFESLDIVAFEENMAEVVWHSVSGTELPPGDVPIEQTKMWWVHQHQQPVCIADWSRDDRFAVRREALKRLGRAYQSLCCIPLRTSRQRLGVLRVASLRSNNFSEDQVRFLYSVADQLALAMSERLSRERLRRTESKLEVSNARFELIMSVVNGVISTEEFGEVLVRVTAQIRRILDCDVALVALLDEQKGGLKIDAIEAVNPGPIAAEETRSKLTAWLDSIVLSAERGKPWTGPVEAFDEIVSGVGTRHAEPTTACVIPIFARGQVLGSMALARGMRESFTADEVAFVSHVATQLALAVEVAIANRELREMHHDLVMRRSISTTRSPVR
jgi:GAF domain-containing protein